MANITYGALTTGVQTVSATGAIVPTAGLAISSIPSTGDWTAFIQLQSLTAAKKVKLQLETSVDSTNWIAVFVIDVQGAIASGQDKIYSIRKYQAPSAPFGTTSCFARLNVTVIDSATTLSLRGWTES